MTRINHTFEETLLRQYLEELKYALNLSVRNDTHQVMFGESFTGLCITLIDLTNGISLYRICFDGPRGDMSRRPSVFYALNIMLVFLCQGIFHTIASWYYNIFPYVVQRDCWVKFYLDCLFNNEITLMVLIMAMDRLWALKWPKSYRRRCTNTKAYLQIIFSWFFLTLLWLCIFIRHFIQNADPNYNTWDPCLWDNAKIKTESLLMAIIAFDLPILITFKCVFDCHKLVNIYKRKNKWNPIEIFASNFQIESLSDENRSVICRQKIIMDAWNDKIERSEPLPRVSSWLEPEKEELKMYYNSLINVFITFSIMFISFALCFNFSLLLKIPLPSIISRTWVAFHNMYGCVFYYAYQWDNTLFEIKHFR